MEHKRLFLEKAPAAFDNRRRDVCLGGDADYFPPARNPLTYLNLEPRPQMCLLARIDMWPDFV